MRREKNFIVSLLVLSLAILLAGCGKIGKKQEEEAREWIEKMITAADGAVVSRVDCITELEAELIYNTQQVEDYKFQFEAHNEYDKESGRTDSEIIAYKDGKPVNLRFHMSEEQGVFYIYTKYDQDVWYKYDTGFLKADMSRNFVSDMNLENAEILDFKKDYKKVNEKSTHKLSVRLKDASIRELLFESGFKALFYGREYNSIDLSDVNVRIDYFVDPENCMVMELEVQLDGMENFLREYTRFTNNSMVEEEFKEAKVKNGKLIYSNISYEDTRVPMLSFEDKKSSFLVYQKDSIYNLKSMDAEAELVCPRRWYIYEKDTNQLILIKCDGKMFISYRLHMPYNYEDLEKALGDLSESHKVNGTYIADKKGPKIGDLDTYEIMTTKGRIIAATTAVNQSMLEIIIEDYSGDNNDVLISEILEKVKLKAIEF